MKLFLIPFLFLISSILAFADDKAKKPTSFQGEVNGVNVWISMRVDQQDSFKKMRTLKGTKFINVEPGCIIVEAFLEYRKGDELKVRMVSNNSFSKRAKKLLGIQQDCFVLKYRPTDIPNRSSKILSVKEIRMETRKFE